MPSSHLILCCPLLLLPSIFPSIRVFSNELAIQIRWQNYWSLSFNISSSNEYSGLVSFRMDWLDLLAVQGTLKSLAQHHSSKASILRYSVFFMVQLTSIHDYWKNRSFDYMDLCWRRDVSPFLIHCHEEINMACLKHRPQVEEVLALCNDPRERRRGLSRAKDLRHLACPCGSPITPLPTCEI